MALHLNRGHFRRPGKCLGGYSLNFRTYERRRRPKKRACTICADGMLVAIFRRKSTLQTGWDESRRVAAGWEAAGTWERGPNLPPPAPVAVRPSPAEPGRAKPVVTIRSAADAYSANRAVRHIAESTISEYRILSSSFAPSPRRAAISCSINSRLSIEFARYAAERRNKRGEGKPEAFGFLGFTHIGGAIHKTGNFTLHRKTTGKRMAAKLKQIRAESRRRMLARAAGSLERLRQVVGGYYQYHAIPGKWG